LKKISSFNFMELAATGMMKTTLLLPSEDSEPGADREDGPTSPTKAYKLATIDTIRGSVLVKTFPTRLLK
jgi:hypothetical protein